MPVSTFDLRQWHQGEAALHELRGYSDDVYGGPPGLTSGLIFGSASFLAQLQFLPITTLDAQGRPWVSLICRSDGQAGFVESLKGEGQDEEGMLRVRNVAMPAGTPLLDHLRGNLRCSFDQNGSWEGERMLMASVGVLLSNRRRNKYEGWIEGSRCDTHGLWELDIGVLTSMGNCPKYINTRRLVAAPAKEALSDVDAEHAQEHNETVAHQEVAGGQIIPQNILDAICAADAVYLATSHSTTSSSVPGDRPRLGCNIRGGRPGFLEQRWDDQRQRHCILLPDYSGNRFLQSLGNIMEDGVAGLAVPVFGRKTKGANTRTDVLYATCDAETTVDVGDATPLARAQTVTRLWVTAYSWVQDALPLIEDDSEEVGWSPYNPILRRPANGASDQKRSVATLVDGQVHSDDLATLQWSADVDLARRYLPGRYVVLDAYELLDTRIKLYTHMAQYRGGEKELNDDGIRSWTISNARVDGQRWLFSITLRRIARGGVTPTLFSLAARASSVSITLPILGVEGSFTPSSNARTLYLCAGVGITPLLAHLRATTGDVLAVVACKAADVEPLTKLMQDAAQSQSNCRLSKLRVHFLVKAGATEADKWALKGQSTAMMSHWPGRRLTESSLAGTGEATANDFVLPVDDRHQLSGRTAFVCGAGPFEQTAKSALHAAGIEDIHSESFSY